MGFQKAGPSLEAATTLGSVHSTELPAGEDSSGGVTLYRGSPNPALLPSQSLPSAETVHKIPSSGSARDRCQRLVAALRLSWAQGGQGSGMAPSPQWPGRPWEDTPAWRAHPGAGQRWGQVRFRQVTAGSPKPRAVRPPIGLERGPSPAPKALPETQKLNL